MTGIISPQQDSQPSLVQNPFIVSKIPNTSNDAFDTPDNFMFSSRKTKTCAKFVSDYQFRTLVKRA